MSNSIRKRTEAEVVEFIKNHSEDGKLTKSLMDIAEHVGYSNATVHRVLKSLEENGVVEIIPAEKPTEPNTIMYKGPIKEANDVVAQGRALLTQLRGYADDVADYIEESNRIILKLREELEEANSKGGLLHARILDRIALPNNEHMLVMVRKEDVPGDEQHEIIFAEESAMTHTN